jgi:hypothetical protein
MSLLLMFLLNTFPIIWPNPVNTDSESDNESDNDDDDYDINDYIMYANPNDEEDGDQWIKTYELDFRNWVARDGPNGLEAWMVFPNRARLNTIIRTRRYPDGYWLPDSALMEDGSDQLQWYPCSSYLLDVFLGHIELQLAGFPVQ